MRATLAPVAHDRRSLPNAQRWYTKRPAKLSLECIWKERRYEDLGHVWRRAGAGYPAAGAWRLGWRAAAPGDRQSVGRRRLRRPVQADDAALPARRRRRAAATARRPGQAR